MWHDSMSDAEWGSPRGALDRDLDVDVVIVGGGFTGLWTAYSLLTRDPHLRVVVLEAEEVGFGASGRNGGWCSALLPMSPTEVAGRHGRDQAMRLLRAMRDTVSEVGRVLHEEGITCDWAHGGTVTLARTQPQLDRLRAHVAEMHRFGYSDDDLHLIDRADATTRCAATNVIGGAFTPHCAAVHPARLVRGLATAVERRGAVIHEQTRVKEIAPHRVVTDRAAVTASVVVRATEAFTPALPGLRRAVAPIYSLMVATEPLSERQWDTIGLADRPTFHDERHLVIYGQRTADGRLAFGGRGAWYHWGSRIDPRFDRDAHVHDRIEDTLIELFPTLADVEFTHRWGGAVAVTRDWWCSVDHDPTTGLATAGGYAGDGVGTSNLAGRILADLITGTSSDLVTLPLVGHRSRRWEPEPLRFIGINAAVRLPIGADRFEERHGRPSRWRQAAMARLIGGPTD
ncbi:MAG: NAD(P)/FAD-dependent oxidoreductase [Ilumatobacteraceae bacterium]